MSTNQSHRPRGSALILAVLAIAVLLMMVVAVVKWGGTASDAVTTKVSGDRMNACAQAARRYLLTQLALSGVRASQVTIPAAGSTSPFTIPDAVNPADRTELSTGHYSSGTDAGVTVQTVSVISSGAMGASRQQARDLTNALPSSALLGGQYFRVVVKCSHTDKHESEYEFVFRYGI